MNTYDVWVKGPFYGFLTINGGHSVEAASIRDAYNLVKAELDKHEGEYEIVRIEKIEG